MSPLFLPIFTIPSALSIELLLSDSITRSQPASLPGYAIFELDGHSVISASPHSKTNLQGDLIWLPYGRFNKLLTVVDRAQSPECTRLRASAHCPITAELVDCWVYVSVNPPFSAEPSSQLPASTFPWDFL